MEYAASRSGAIKAPHTAPSIDGNVRAEFSVLQIYVGHPASPPRNKDPFPSWIIFPDRGDGRFSKGISSKSKSPFPDIDDSKSTSSPDIVTPAINESNDAKDMKSSLVGGWKR